MKNAKYIEVVASVRYWEDAIINGEPDESGDMTPCCNKDGAWNPIISIENGVIVLWPNGVTANIHFKVCDEGEYYLLNENMERIYKWDYYYVPEDVLAIGESGYGDYIIMEIGGDGKIKDWSPSFDDERWVAVAA